jgi:HSP20 family protein
MALTSWDAAAGVRGGAAGRYVPAADVAIGDRDIVAAFDVPGVDPADLAVEVHDGFLTVRGSRRPAWPDQAPGRARRERPAGTFERTLRLPADADVDAITAALDKGVLSLIIPRLARPAAHRVRIGEAQPADATTEKKPRRLSLDGIAAELVRGPRRRA